LPKKFGFADKALFHTLINTLRWDEKIKRWRVGTNRGDDIRARFVILACGVLNMPKLPNVPGITDFKGKIFHTARWDYDYTGGSYQKPVLDKLRDKRVAILGTGATAIQAVPHLGKYAKQLYVLQRTPSSVDERPNPPTDTEWVKSLKAGWQDERRANFQRAAVEFLKPGEPDLVCDIWTEINRNLAAELEAEGWPQLSPQQFMARREAVDFRVMERLRQRVEQLVADKTTAEPLKPYYRFLCKRPLSSDAFYPTFNRPNVELIDVSDTKGVERMTEHGFVANGKQYDVDCMIFASGFEVTSDLNRRWGIDVVEGRARSSMNGAARPTARAHNDVCRGRNGPGYNYRTRVNHAADTYGIDHRRIESKSQGCRTEVVGGCSPTARDFRPGRRAERHDARRAPARTAQDTFLSSRFRRYSGRGWTDRDARGTSVHCRPGAGS
jgi:cation diffusion facilitator CzcD-associated flavoprotein CzcO